MATVIFIFNFQVVEAYVSIMLAIMLDSQAVELGPTFGNDYHRAELDAGVLFDLFLR